jgi:hypothetical protein
VLFVVPTKPILHFTDKYDTPGNTVGPAGTLDPALIGLLGIDALTQIGLTCTAINVINGVAQTWYVT